MKRIYLDNSATSYPKAPSLGAVLSDYIENSCVNINRTESSLSYENFEFLYSLRENLCTLFGFDCPESIGFTPNVTYAMNWLIKGLLSPSDHVVTTSVEHNAVMRPLQQSSISFSSIPCDSAGRSLTEEAENLIQKNTRAFIITAASNVSGAIQDVKALCTIAKKHNLLTIVDTAQAAPYIDLNMKEMGIDALAFTGHKGLLGPHGTGGFLLRKDLALRINPLVSGGTGSFSHTIEIPPVLPDRLSPGTENLVGLCGLSHSVQYVLDNLQTIREKSRTNTSELCKGLEEICREFPKHNLKIVGPSSKEQRTEAISLYCPEPSDLSAFLLEKYGIETRAGLHCSPCAHKALGTFPKGTIRFSASSFTTKEEISITLEAVREFFALQI
ncbi:MAG: aminotransferase class V-fold PLP-dependent enzyme [Sphaerochaetaceae bacterium]|nr:aminotransferase class V-fold PLP-dependent enzyme [Sphaerochaetaceae bacterium]